MPRDAATPFLLTVLTGPNAGAQMPLSGRSIRIGRAAGAEIGLDDDDAGDVALSFSRDRLRIVPRTEGAALAGGAALPAGRPAIAALPAILNLGPRTQIHVCRVAMPARRPLAVRALPGAALTLVAGALAIAAAASVMSDDEEPRRAGAALDVPSFADAGLLADDPADDAAPDGVEEVAQQATEPPPLPDAATGAAPAEEAPADPAAAAADALRAMTLEAGLIGLNVAAEGGAVRVTGRQSPDQADDWHRVREAYDVRFGSAAPLVLEVSEEEVGAPLAVASAWLGESPEITTRAGDVLAVGDVTADGWEVARIVAGEVHLSRDAQTLVIEF